jgi:hypothetical protein
MLRIELRDSAGALNVKLEGRFTGDHAEHARSLIARYADHVKLVVDLTDVVYVDAVGEQVLSFLGRLGAEFAAATSYTVDVCERLQLRLAQRNGSAETATSASRANETRPAADLES